LSKTDSHVLRVYHSRKFIIGENVLVDPKPGVAHSLKLHNNPGTDPPTEYVIVAGNEFRGNDWAVELGPKNRSSNEVVRHVVFERNLITIQSTGDRRGVSVFGPDITLRNNVFNATGSEVNDYEAIVVQKQGIGPLPERVRVYHNTLYRPNGEVTLCKVAGNVTDVVVMNNLAVTSAAGLAASKIIEGAGTCTQSNNLLVAVEGVFVDAAGKNFQLAKDSPAHNAGVPIVGSILDYRGRLRLVDADSGRKDNIDVDDDDANKNALPTVDVGAFESQSDGTP
jgi:hypothetical protein